MAKLSRSVLKEIVKECIVEIFEESFFPGQANLMESDNQKSFYQASVRQEKNIQQNSKRQRRPNVNTSHLGSRSSLDTVSYGTQQNPRNDAFEKRINEVTSNITTDPVMSDIFRDTAKTTMQAQNSAESGRRGQASILNSGDKAAVAASQSDPMELFSESASKWATLAFSDPVNK